MQQQLAGIRQGNFERQGAVDDDKLGSGHEATRLSAARSTNCRNRPTANDAHSLSLPELATELKRRRPALPVVLVTDWGNEDAPEPSVGFDRVLCRLDGPAVLLQTLRELLAGVIAISTVSKESATETVSRSRQLREAMAGMRETMRHTRELSQEARQRKLNQRK